MPVGSPRKAALVVLLVVGIGAFGYSQYASASQIEVSVSQSRLLGSGEGGSEYDVELLFENPSLLLLRSGETEFFVVSGDRTVGSGTLEPFTLQPMGSIRVGGTFHSDPGEEAAGPVKITGVTKYDLILASLDVPFVYHPTDEQAREFIRTG